MFVIPVYKGVPHYNYFNTAKKNLGAEIKKKPVSVQLLNHFFMNRSIARNIKNMPLCQILGACNNFFISVSKN